MDWQVQRNWHFLYICSINSIRQMRTISYMKSQLMYIKKSALLNFQLIGHLLVCICNVFPSKIVLAISMRSSLKINILEHSSNQLNGIPLKLNLCLWVFVCTESAMIYTTLTPVKREIISYAHHWCCWFHISHRIIFSSLFVIFSNSNTCFCRLWLPTEPIYTIRSIRHLFTFKHMDWWFHHI